MEKARGFWLASLVLMPGVLSAQQRYFHLLVGTYTSGKSEGIYVYQFDNQTGKLELEFTAKGVENPSFLAASPDGKYIYAANELPGDKGAVSAFRFDPSSGALELINSQSSGSAGPCYVSVSRDGRYVLAANYSGGSIAVLPRKADGSLEPLVQHIRYEGSSVNPQRQKQAHLHSVVFSPDGNQVLAADLGSDKLYSFAYRPDRAEGPLEAMEPSFVSAQPGSGPRHIVYDADGKYVYLVEELSASVSVYRHSGGRLELLQRLPMTAPDFTGEQGAAEIKISPDGEFLYASNRGTANELAVYSRDAASGRLEPLGRQSSMGETPRNFTISPEGNFLLVANQESEEILVFKRDLGSGLLESTANAVQVGKPVYLLMLPKLP